MAVNRRRGEVEAMLDGKPWRLCLTLGALAELEDAFGAGDLQALVERLSGGRLSARDLTAILAAGLRGGGHALPDTEVAAMLADGGVAAYARIATDLLTAAFGQAAAPETPANP